MTLSQDNVDEVDVRFHCGLVRGSPRGVLGTCCWVTVNTDARGSFDVGHTQKSRSDTKTNDIAVFAFQAHFGAQNPNRSRTFVL